ncbi:MAG: prepilin peptidase [Candidatus Promineifilaceae bacterium]|nr:prepilin peptidase [Candidatus Promineifilaceae bacterium]
MAVSLPIMIMTGFYILVLLLIILVDVKRRRVLNIVALPATATAIFFSLSQGTQAFYLTVLGAVIGYLFFYILYWLGARLYGPGALGFGDVKLAMLLGAMLGLQQIMFALALGLLLAGLAAGVLLFASQHCHRRSKLPYGAFLAAAGIFTLIWNVI